MSRRAEWQPVLDSEVKRWSALSAEELVSVLDGGDVYEIEFASKTYQVEVELLENTAEYVHVSIAVDDGTLPASLCPLGHNFIKKKTGSSPA